jgi:CheY-like chemotaxis protein
MAERIVLCIEPEATTVDEIRRALEPYAFKVESIPNGEEAIEWGRANPPVLIILSVEPRKVGYAICNKLKRSPSLRDVPLILISSEETLATFEQHKKLKSHADEYLLKPLDLQDLLARIERRVGLGDGEQAAGEDDEHIEEIDADSDIVIADEEEVAHVASADGAEPKAGGDDGVPATPAPAAQDVTSEQRVVSGEGESTPSFEGERFDPETQAAFAALEAGTPEGPSASGEMVDLRNLWSDEDLPAALNWEAPTAVGKDEPIPAAAIRPEARAGGQADLESTSQGDRRAPDPDSYRTGETLGPERIGGGSDAYETVDSTDSVVLDAAPGLEDLNFEEPTTDGAARAPSQMQDLEARLGEQRARNTELQARIESLEHERQTLRRELEEARERFTQSATFSKEREFLGLREIINKKDKDILDLRDDLDAKERLILDHKDKIRELERARRDLDEKTLGFERNLVAASEKVAELAQDRDKSSERERGLKARLDDAHEELRKSHEAVDALKKKFTQDEARLRLEMDRVRNELETRLVEIDEAHASELARMADERAAAEASAAAAREAERARSEAAHKAEVEGLQRRAADDQAAATDRLNVEITRLRKEHEKALAALRDEQAAQLAHERQAYEAQTEQKERDRRNEIVGMARRHEEELAAAEERRQKDIVEQEVRRVGELEGAENRRRAELQTRDEEHHARVTELERRHLIEKTDLAERNRSELDQTLGRAARAEGELAARVQELEQAHRRIAGVVADLDAARAELGDREVRLAQSRDIVAQLETKVASYEDQVVRAYQRIRADEKSGEKARRALAVALALLDERAGTPGAQHATSSSGPTAIAATPPAATVVTASKPVAEEA